MSAPEPRYFLDSNVLVYAHDPSAHGKNERARALVRERWERADGCLSVQVLQEFFVTVTSKVPQPLTRRTAADHIADLSTWTVHAPTANDVLDAVQLQHRHKVSFWDAMVIASANALGCTTLLSEDLNHGQRYGAVEVRNPFRSD